MSRVTAHPLRQVIFSGEVGNKLVFGATVISIEVRSLPGAPTPLTPDPSIPYFVCCSAYTALYAVALLKNLLYSRLPELFWVSYIVLYDYRQRNSF
jgi:hypothetical protein